MEISGQILNRQFIVLGVITAFEAVNAPLDRFLELAALRVTFIASAHDRF